MRRVGSLLIEIARECAVPAGHAVAVDRALYSAKVTEVISREPLIQILREEVTEISENELTIIATGPLTSDALSLKIVRLSGNSHLYFYDSISPIVEDDSVDMGNVSLPPTSDKGTAPSTIFPMLIVDA